MFAENIVQRQETWDTAWKNLTPESEIRMWDFYGLRHWILKYVPRHGKVIEAGCGLGRYIFYLSKMGVDIEGMDFSRSSIEYLNKWKTGQGFLCKFIHGDVTHLPYPDNSLSGYISLGVVEHFVEGPKKPIKEAFSKLRPGGIAIISTPSVSFNILKQRIEKALKTFVKRISFYKINNDPFFQYWYRPSVVSHK